MQEIIAIIKNATDALPDPADVKTSRRAYQARDWAGFFAALAAFAQKLLPLLLPLAMATEPDTP
jgi:hypothetical protein